MKREEEAIYRIRRKILVTEISGSLVGFVGNLFLIISSSSDYFNNILNVYKKNMVLLICYHLFYKLLPSS